MTGPAGTRLPIATPPQVRRAAAALIRQDGRIFAAMVLLNGFAAAAGLVGPWLLGRIIDRVRAGDSVATVDRLALTILLFALVQVVLGRYARYLAYRFGERTLARIREQFLERALALPAALIERAGTGDVSARGTNDVALVGTTVRDAGPEVIVAAAQATFIVIAVFAIDPLFGACGVVGSAGIWVVLRWYLRRARSAYLAAGAAYSTVAEVLTDTAGGARTIEAFGLQERRLIACRQAIEENRRTSLRTLFLRSVLFPVVDVSYTVPVVGVLLLGYVLHQHDVVSLGAVVASVLYLRQLSQPVDTILFRIEALQNSGASFARVEGMVQAPRGAERPAGADPVDDRIEVRDVRFAYTGGEDVLHGVDLSIRPGERLAVVGPSGAGKTTLGRLLAGIDRPRTGSLTVGGVPVADLGPEQLRRQVVVVTQEQHIFLGSVRDNLQIATPTADDAHLLAALDAVEAEWIHELPAGLDTPVGTGGEALDHLQAQQIALARVVLADPHTVILDEATAMLDPTTARRTERALAAVLNGRTVIAIAHRLHTAHDADRVAVMEAGHITEVGTHDELVRAGGPYSALWNSWHGAPVDS